MIASPWVSRKGPTYVYGLVETAIQELGLGDAFVLEVSVVNPKRAIVEALRGSLRTEPSFSAIHLGKDALEDLDLGDKYVYRIER